MRTAQYLSGRYVIAGIGSTAFGRLGLDTVSLNAMACCEALADASIDREDVDALLLKAPTSAREMLYGQKVAEALGMQPRWGGAWDQGGAANITLISFAIMAIETGQCDVALISYADNPRSGSGEVYNRPRGGDAPHGWYSPGAWYAMIQQRHIIEYGTPQEAFGAVAMAARRHGAANPKAQLRRSLTMEDYLSAPYQIEPMRRDDCCLVSDGGAAVVVMSAERARELRVPAPVPILGLGGANTSAELQNRVSLTTTAAVRSAGHAFAMAGARPTDVDVAQIYDCFSVAVLMTLEDYGFCAKGRVNDFVRDGQIEIGGRMPVNTSGGLLSETGMPGMQLIHEGVRQMRGSAVSQVAGAKLCAISNQGGAMHTHATLLLGH
ncbi:MAG: thiolase family protein [Bradyrhizobium sp.]